MQLSNEDLNIYHILQNLDETKSISKASEAAGIKPGTGRKLISTLEGEIGKEIVDSKPFEGSEISAKGRKLLRYYRRAERYINRMNRRIARL